MPAVTQAQVRFVNLKGEPLKEEGGRIYIFTTRGTLPAKDCHLSFTPWVQELITQESGKFVKIANSTKFAAAKSIVLTRKDPNGPYTHFAIYTKKPVTDDYLTKVWGQVRDTGTIICDGNKAGGFRIKADATGDWIVELDTEAFPYTSKNEIMGLALYADGKPIERRPNAQGVIQVVPEPATTTKFQIMGEQPKDAGEAIDLMKEWRAKKKSSPNKTFRAWAKEKKSSLDHEAKKERKDLQKKGHSWGEMEGSLEVTFSWGGSKEITPKFEYSSDKPQKKGELTVTGGKYKAKTKIEEGEELKLQHPGWLLNPNDLKFSAEPAKFQFSGKGTTGPEQNLTVEVFPSTQILAELKFTTEYLGKKFDKVNKYFGDLNKKGSVKGKGVEFGGFKLEVEGGISYLASWKEKEADWKVAFFHTIGAEVGITLGFPSLSISALQLGFGIPQTISDYVGDIRLSIGAEGKFTFGGEVGLEAESPLGKIASWEGKIELKLAVFLPIELKGFIGKEGAIGATIKAEFKPGLYGKGVVTRNGEGQKAATLSAGLEKAEVETTLTLDYFIGSKNWTLGKVKCWDEIEFGQLGPYILSE